MGGPIGGVTEKLSIGEGVRAGTGDSNAYPVCVAGKMRCYDMTVLSNEVFFLPANDSFCQWTRIRIR